MSKSVDQCPKCGVYPKHDQDDPIQREVCLHWQKAFEHAAARFAREIDAEIIAMFPQELAP